MRDSDKYKHIKVSASHSDDVVIKAGRRDNYGVEGESTDDCAHIFDSTDSSNDSEKPSHMDRPQANADAGSSKSDYMPTTLEDIETSKMSKVQIVIIVIAVIAIAAFVIWYIAF